MKGVFWIALIVSLMTSATHAYTGFGICNFGKEKISDVICYGPTILKETTIDGDIKVAGSFKAESITVGGSMMIAGDANILSSKISGLADISGHLEANGVAFMNDLNITSNSTILTNSKVNGSVKVTSQQSKASLVMQCGTIVTGTISFDGKAGVVQMTEDSSIQGKIVNGTQEFIQKKCT